MTSSEISHIIPRLKKRVGKKIRVMFSGIWHEYVLQEVFSDVLEFEKEISLAVSEIQGIDIRDEAYVELEEILKGTDTRTKLEF